ncbi:MAG: mucoidy inhibitor MuiA family protein [Planctomycetota bacterium]
MLLLLLPLALGDPTPVNSRIQDVTLYGSSALVRRTAGLGGSGSFVLQGLPESIDPDNVRVRCEGGDVVGVEVRRRVAQQVPGERVQGLRDRQTALERELRVLEDERDVLKSMRGHLKSLMDVSAAAQEKDVQGGKPSIEAWSASWTFCSERLAEIVAATRDLDWKIEAKGREIQEVQAEIGRCVGAGTVTLYDVLVDVAAPGQASLDVEYLVSRTGWQPAYDLRASSDLKGVELTYRARVWQQTGEDWKDVDLVLSTASPQRGAQGPEPQPVWLNLYEPPVAGKRFMAPASEAVSLGEEVRGMADADLEMPVDSTATPAPRPFAAVENQGLSVHFRLAQKETIESRELPTTVLVGSAPLEIKPERVCVPALDTTVWLRAKAKNTSPWVLLPGTAGVFFGADYLGPAEIATVQTGEELTLHLGADPGITCERSQTQDLSKGPGFLSSRSTKVEAWRMHFENHGTVGTAADGSVEVIVRDVLPRSSNDKIEVEISKVEPKPSTDELWKQDREEKGIVTWVVRVPTGEKGADVVFETEVTYPKGAKLVRN